MHIITPKAAGFSTQRLNRLDNYLQNLVDKNIVAGSSVTLARRGEIFHQACLGMMDIEANKATRPDTIFRIYSMTKPIASVALMMLYEEGHFLLDDPVSTYIPAFKDLRVMIPDTVNDTTSMQSEITIRQLLTHTAGLGYGLFEDSPLEDMYRAKKIFSPVLKCRVSLAEIIENLSQLPLAFQPGTGWRYSMATDVVGYLVQLMANIPFDTFLKERVFAPLGMFDTDFYVHPENLNRLAAMYGVTKESNFALIDPPATSAFTNPEFTASGGAGLLSTVDDYLRFAQMLLNGGEFEGARLLSPHTIKMMTTNHLSPDLMPICLGDKCMFGYGFGLGFRVMVDVTKSGIIGSNGEYGWAGAAGTYFWIDPQTELIGLMMMQYLPASMLSVPIRDMTRLLTYQALIER